MIFTKGNIELKRLEVNPANAKRTIYVVPTNRKARKLKKELITKGARPFYVETLGTLASKLLAEVEPFQPLDDAIGAYLLKKAAGEITPKFFTRFRGGAFPKGTLERIGRVISEYKRKGLTPEIFLKEVGEASLEQSELNKAEDIAEIYTAYLKSCRELNALEIGDVYSDLLKLPEGKFSTVFALLFPGVDAVYFQYFTEFAPTEINLINKIYKAGISLAIEFDYSEKNPLLFEALKNTIGMLRKSGFREKETLHSKANDLAKYLEQNLFRYDAPKRKFSEAAIFSGNNKFEEVENIAKIIKDLVNAGTPPHKIAVAFNLISEYSPVVRTVFAGFGIPFNLSDRLTLDKSPAVKALLTFLEIKKNSFYYRTLFSAINNGYAQNLIANSYNLQKFAQSFGIISSEKTWRERIELAATQARTENEKREVEAVKNDFEEIVKLLEIFDGYFSPEEFLVAFKKFVSEYGIAQVLLEIDDERAEQNITAVSRLLESFKNVLNLITKERGEKFKEKFDFYYEVLVSVASWSRFNVKERSDYGVLVTSAEELRGLKFDYVFFGGLNDGVLPLKYSPEIFFSENFMQKEEEKLAEQRFVFYNVFNSFAKRIYLSYADASEKTELSRSVFLEDFLQIIQPEEIDAEYFTSRIYSRGELQINFAERSAAFDEKTSAEIARKISAYKAKKLNSESVFNGYLTAKQDEAVKKFLEKFSAGTFSVSQFESYGSCPFKYFAERILKIEVLEDPEKEIEPILLGNYLHETLFEFYTRLNANAIDINSGEAEDLLFSIGEELFEKYSFDDEIYFYEREKFFGINGNKYDSIFYKFLEKEREEIYYKPGFFEVSFGRKLGEEEKYDKNLSTEFPVEISGVKISGKIDRIDIADEKFAVIDYKSGNKTVSYNSIMRGADLQLPIYLSVTEKLLGEKYQPSMMAIYKLKFGETKFGLSEIKNGKKRLSDENIRELTLAAEKYVGEYYSCIKSGKFSPTNYEKRETDVCQYCDFKALCRIDEREN